MKSVVILGGGYAGVSALSVLGLSSDVKVTLIDQHPYHYLQPEVYGYIANKTNLADITISLVAIASFYKNTLFLQKKVIGVDFNKQFVIFSDNETLNYDYLIIATGARTLYFNFIEGLKENSHGIKNLCSAMEFKQKFEVAMYKNIESGECKKEPLNIIVGGAGLSGVEIASSLAEYANSLFTQSGFDCSGMEVYLVNADKTILFGMDNFIIENSLKKLEKLGVKVLSDKRVTKVTQEKVYIHDGQEINMDFMIWTGGIIASSLTKNFDTEKNRLNQVISDKYLRFSGLENVFVAGDVAQIKSKDDKNLPPTSQIAIASGVFVAQNILNSIRKIALKEADFSLKGVMVAIGLSDAIGVAGNIKLDGVLAYYLKQYIFYKYKKPLLKMVKKY